MNPKLLSAESGLPLKAIRELERIGIVKADMSIEDMDTLHAYASTWGNRALLRLQISGVNRQERASMLFGAGHDKLERYAIIRFLGHLVDREESGGRKLMASQVVDEIMGYYKVKACDKGKIASMVYKMRKKAYNTLQNCDDVSALAKELTTFKNRRTRNTPHRHNKNVQPVYNLFGY